MNFGTALALMTVSVLVVGPLGYVVVRQPGDDYWSRRARLLRSEEARMLGGELNFEDDERKASDRLMLAKHREVDDACEDPRKFLPSQSFLLASEKISESPVFKIIQSMPKGSVLHAHDTAIVSADYLLTNITYRANLYGCEAGAELRLRFFDKPANDCQWLLLSELRMNKSKDVDARIARQATMTTSQPELAYPTVDAAWQKFVSIFMFITPFLTYRPVYEDHFYQGLLEFYNDNILYLELRTTLPTLYDLDGTTYEDVEVAKIYKNVTDRFLKDYPDFVGVKLIYAPLRKCKEVQLDKYLETARQLKKELPDFIAGFDLVGQEEKGQPLAEFADKLRSLGDNVHVFFHAGETNWYGTSTDENLLDAVMLNSKRIGHGFALLKHPEIMDLVRKNVIAIEISPISNQVLALVKDLRNHPASALFADNYPVVVSNDDPGLWGARGLSYDFYQAFVGMMSRNADLRALKKLALNSIEYSSMDEAQRVKAKEIWNRRWKTFVAELAESAVTKSR